VYSAVGILSGFGVDVTAVVMFGREVVRPTLDVVGCEVVEIGCVGSSSAFVIGRGSAAVLAWDVIEPGIDDDGSDFGEFGCN
jgi:hypothetical protein